MDGEHYSMLGTRGFMKAAVIHNPTAGMGDHRSQLDVALQVLREFGWSVETRETHGCGEATRLARDAAERGYDAAFAVGGDGTLNEVLNGLLGSDTAVGVLPLGTANVWAIELGLPLGNLTRAAALQANAAMHWIDVGVVQGDDFGPRAFLLSCGAGLDAQVVDVARHRRTD